MIAETRPCNGVCPATSSRRHIWSYSILQQIDSPYTTPLQRDDNTAIGTEQLTLIDALDEPIEHLSTQITEHIRPFEELCTLLCTIPGIGRRTAEILLAELGSNYFDEHDRQAVQKRSVRRLEKLGYQVQLTLTAIET